MAVLAFTSICYSGTASDCILRDHVGEATSIPHLRDSLILERRVLARQFQQSQKESREFAVGTQLKEVEGITRETHR